MLLFKYFIKKKVTTISAFYFELELLTTILVNILCIHDRIFYISNIARKI